MDLQNAVLLLAITGGSIELGKALLPDSWARNKRVLVAVCIVASFATTFLLRYSVWAHEQVVGDKPLDTLGVASLIVVALAVAATECAAFLVLKGAGAAVSNVGQPMPMPLGEVLANLEEHPDTHASQPADPLDTSGITFDV